jgi:hypothetical protein
MDAETRLHIEFTRSVLILLRRKVEEAINDSNNSAFDDWMGSYTTEFDVYRSYLEGHDIDTSAIERKP